MRIRSLATVLAISTIGTFCSAAGALADSPASDATQACLQGPQLDYYQIIGGTEDAPPILDYGSLAHGSDETGPYVIAQNYSDCVSFIAKNSKGKSSNTNPVHYMVFVMKDVLISSVPPID